MDKKLYLILLLGLFVSCKQETTETNTLKLWNTGMLPVENDHLFLLRETLQWEQAWEVKVCHHNQEKGCKLCFQSIGRLNTIRREQEM